jgi:RNA polymerase sigma factor (sigma-70 family)
MVVTNLVGDCNRWVDSCHPWPAEGSGGISVGINQVADTVLSEPQAKPSADDDDLIQVVVDARAGKSEAWEILVERFGGLVAAVARRCRLSEADVAEVGQTTWLRLVENIDRIEQPERLGGWLATTSRRESIRIATRQTSVPATDAVFLIADEKADPLDAGLLRDEQVQAIRIAAERLPMRCQRLLGLLMADDDLPYKEIGEQLNMPVGSIGPTRGRCLDHLRQMLAEMELSPTLVSR